MSLKGHLRIWEGTGAEMSPESVSGIVTGDAPVSYWSIPSNNPRSLCAQFNFSPLSSWVSFSFLKWRMTNEVSNKYNKRPVLKGHFTVVCLVPRPLHRNEAEVDVVLLQTFLFFTCKLSCSRDRQNENETICSWKVGRFVKKQGHLHGWTILKTIKTDWDCGF